MRSLPCRPQRMTCANGQWLHLADLENRFAFSEVVLQVDQAKLPGRSMAV